jgi:hypothetical protein
VNSLSWKILTVLALALVVTGCGPKGPPLYKAGGTVTYNTKPVDGATVTFEYPDGNFANGVTDAAGKFQLTYMGKPGGAAPGKCKVSVIKSAAIANVTPPAAGEKDPIKMMEAMKKASAPTMKEGGGVAAPKALIPLKYASSTGSGLSFEIKTTEKDNDFLIELKD